MYRETVGLTAMSVMPSNDEGGDISTRGGSHRCRPLLRGRPDFAFDRYRSEARLLLQPEVQAELRTSAWGHHYHQRRSEEQTATQNLSLATNIVGRHTASSETLRHHGRESQLGHQCS